MRKIFLLLVFLLSFDAYAQTCAIASAPSEGFCARRAPGLLENPGDFLFAFRVNGSVQCVDFEFVNYIDRGAGKIEHWFTTAFRNLDRMFFTPGVKEVYRVASVNTWTAVYVYAHRGSCYSLRQLVGSTLLYPAPGAIGTRIGSQGGLRNTPP